MISKNAEMVYATPLGMLRGYIRHDSSLHIDAELKMHCPPLLSDMTVSECGILQWNIRVTGKCPGVRAVCVLEPHSKVGGGSDSGQCFDAQTWNDGTHILTLGTWDSEYLNILASRNVIPRRFATEDTDGIHWVRYIDLGLEIEVPDLREGEMIALRFSFAWATKAVSGEHLATWFAANEALAGC